MVCADSRVRSAIKAILLVVVWSNFTTGDAEVIQIVTPTNSNNITVTTTVAPTQKNKTVDWTKKDSYLQAYKDLHRTRPVKRNDQSQTEQPYNTLLRSSYVPEHQYPSLTQDHSSQSPPSGTYGPYQQSPQTTYGPYSQSPSVTYGPQHQSSSVTYGPQHQSPSVTYGPHHHSPPATYGPHHHHSFHHHDYAPSHGWHEVPYSSPSPSFLYFLPKKLSLKLLLKIILKLVLFKMIVKFIAVLCLLLFIPTLKTKASTHASEEDEERRMRQLDLMSNLIWSSIEGKKSAYDEVEELEDIKDIMEEADKEPSSGPEAAVRFLQFCVDMVDRVVGFMLSYLRRKRNEEVDLSKYFLQKFYSLVEGMKWRSGWRHPKQGR